MTRVLAIGALAFALTGCGTVQNFTEGRKGHTKPYGGAQIAVERFNDDPLAIALHLPLWLADVPLSAIGDTLTLPVVVCTQVVRSMNAYYFPSEGETPQNTWREFWLRDALPTVDQPAASGDAAPR